MNKFYALTSTGVVLLIERIPRNAQIPLSRSFSGGSLPQVGQTILWDKHQWMRIFSNFYSRVINAGAGWLCFAIFEQWRRFDQWRHSGVSKFNDTISWYFYRYTVPVPGSWWSITVHSAVFVQTVLPVQFLIQLMENFKWTVFDTTDLGSNHAVHSRCLIYISIGIFEQYHGSFPPVDWILGLVVGYRQRSGDPRSHVMLSRMPVQPHHYLHLYVYNRYTIRLYLHPRCRCCFRTYLCGNLHRMVLRGLRYSGYDNILFTS